MLTHKPVANPASARALSIRLAALAAVVLFLIVLSWACEGDLLAPEANSLAHLRIELEKNPTDKVLLAEIRREDQRLRTAYFNNRNLRETGGYIVALLLGAALLAGARYRSLGRRANPGPLPDIARACRPRSGRPEFYGLALALFLVVALFVVSACRIKPLPTFKEPPKPGPAPTFRDNWPCFRGPSGQGLVPKGVYPKVWDGEKGTNVIWRTPVGIVGESSPVIWGDRIFLTGGDERRRQVACFDRTKGKRLWTTLIKTPAGVKLEVNGEPLEIYPDTGYAAPTPVTDGRYVYAIFATGDVAAVDFSGKVKWVRNLGVPESAYGYSSSLAFYGGQLLVQYDQGNDPDAGLSALLALAPETGKTLWRKSRPVGASWSSPVILQTKKGPQLVTCGNPWVITYNPQDGTEYWRANVLYGDVAPAAVYAEGLFFVTNDMAAVVALKGEGKGDVSKSHLLWESQDGMSDISSPVTDGKYLLQARGDGQMTCFAALTGKLVWEEFADRGFKSSPLLVGDQVYFIDSGGRTLIFPLADKFAVSRTNDLGESVSATPAFGDGCIYIRGYEHLFCIGKKK